MGTITNNFSYSEFEYSRTAIDFGIDNTITTFEVRDAVKALTVEILQPLRDAIRHAVNINSGYRCPQLNAAVGGVPTSQHAKGEAADIAVPGLKPVTIARKIVELGLPYDQLILYPTFCHISHRSDGKPQRGQLLYNKAYKGEKV